MSDIPPGADRSGPEQSASATPKPEAIIGTNTVAAQKRQGFLARVSGFFHKQNPESNLGQIVNMKTGETRIVRKGNEPGGYPKPPTDVEVKAAEIDRGEGLPIMWAKYEGAINQWLKTASLRNGSVQGREVLMQIGAIANRPNEGGSVGQILKNAASALARAIDKGVSHGA